jgi:hypothetical protein
MLTILYDEKEKTDSEYVMTASKLSAHWKSMLRKENAGGNGQQPTRDTRFSLSAKEIALNWRIIHAHECIGFV